ncbi:MAG: DNA mismatch repair endonuclease MutL [Lachnospiraceae bacterium]|nr:DNA mismatch repair endonuclease MutL [Lachnospiraceae bacterium]
MNAIEVLDKNTIDRIAAGEVVERPSSIVKELVENAIDSGADAINIEIKDGGISFIRITDNGCGIESSQVKKAFFRHSTSKLRHVSDLASISTLGFRGEALSSISSVSKVELITKVPDSLTGVRYVIEGGAEVSFQEIGAPGGTTIIVRDIFYNTPARKKFLKSPGTEGGYISSIVERLVLSHPDIAFNFIINGSTRIHSSGNGSIKDIIYSIYGREISSNALAIDTENEGIRLRGFICKPTVSRGNRNFENYYVNGRYVKNNIITRGIEDAFKPYMMQHRYPFTQLFIDIPGDRVDVNVHPAKQEVRFSDGETVYSTVNKALFDALGEKDLTPEISLTMNTHKPEKAEISKSHPEPFETVRKTDIPAYIPADDLVREEPRYLESSLFKKDNKTSVKPVQISFSDIVPESKGPSVKVIGQVFDTYWIIEYEDKMYIIDQHAAHEKVMYERILKSLKNKTHSSQLISPPVVVTLTPAEDDKFSRNKQVFESLGFEISFFGGNEYIISAVPLNIFNIDYKDVFVELLDSLEENNSPGPEIMLDRMAGMSCKAAVKGNNALTFAEAEELIKEMFTLDNPFNCPHGRPTVISMSKSEMEKHFKRIL